MEEVVASETDPIPLYQVLEEEYATLHGPLPVDYNLDNNNPDERFAAICELIHKLSESRAALCLSGGGIRSGTFSLGVLQGLARRDLLNKFHFLSTVSGGGYIGSWLTAWTHRNPKGLKGTTEELALTKITPKFEPEPSPIRNLRDYSSFLTPRFSLLSADVWTFVAIYVRNLILNWLVIIPLLVAVLAIPRLCIAFVRVHPPEGWGMWCSTLIWAPFVIGVVCVGNSVGYMGLSRPTVSDLLPAGSKWRKKEYKNQKSFLVRCLLPLCLGTIFLTTHWAWNTALLKQREVRVEEQAFQFLADQTSLANVQKEPELEGWQTTPILYPLSRSLVGFIVTGITVYLIGWAKYSIVLRNIRWKELLSVFVTGIVGGLLLWIVATKLFPDPIVDPVCRNPLSVYPEDDFGANPISALYVCLASPLFLGAILLAVTFFIGLTSRPRGTTLVFEDEDREWLSRFGGWVLIVGPVALWKAPAIITSLGGISGLIAILTGHSSKTAANNTEAAKSGLKAMILNHVLGIASAVFIVFLIAGLSLITSLTIEGILLGLLKGLSQGGFAGRLIEGMSAVSDWYTFDTAIPAKHFGELHLYKIIHYTPVRYLLAWIGVLCAFGFGMAKVINLNKFSLHAAYRNRLIRAYLGASRNEDERTPSPFTGFDPTDNLQMHELRPGLLQLKSFKTNGLGSLVLKLRAANNCNAKTDPSAYLRETLSDQTRTLVDRYSSGEPSQSLKNDLIEDLNRILETRYLYRQQAFANVKVGNNTIDLIKFLAPISEHVEAKQGQSIRSLIEESLLTPDERREVAKPQNKKEKESKTNALVSRSLRGVYLIGLNRYLLDEIYSDEIEERPIPLPPFKLMHVVNTALNLVSGDKLAWQQRKAEAFSVSPLHCGSVNPRLGYRRSRDYGGPRGISLGTAVAISGAAASSNMGYMSTSSATTFVMTLFNARLGWWLGNPGEAGNNFYSGSCPNFSISPIVAEAFGLTDDRNAYVLLSDGGHFENLGIYEMVLRRCKFIVAIDGSQDARGEFDDLGNAVRKIRIDFGIPIDFKEVSIFGRSDKKQGRRCAVGSIQYSAIDKVRSVVDGKEETRPADDGYLIYIKPAFYGKDEPRDIYNYAVSHEAFPHDTTADQWFDEPQFESYRMLGRHTIREICGRKKTHLSLEKFHSLAAEHSKLKDDKDDPLKHPAVKAIVDFLTGLEG